MGRKKKFIDKKKSATFQLLARDSSDPNYSDTPGGDRVFIRVDNNTVSVDRYFDGETPDDGEDSNSIFADAPGDTDGEDGEGVFGSSVKFGGRSSAGALPEEVRREILELGFPDDGYNYLLHLREIKNTGGGSYFYSNPKANSVQLPNDVKAYDASKVRVPEVKVDDANDKSIYNVASKTVGVRLQKVLDPEVAALLDDSDLSRFGSDVEDLEEDFIVRANCAEDESDLAIEESLNSIGEFNGHVASSNQQISQQNGSVEKEAEEEEEEDAFANEKPRARRMLDEQFDLLESQEYGTDDEDDDYGGYYAEEDESLANKLNDALKDSADFEVDDKYLVPADLLHGDEKTKSKESVELAAAVVQRCVEYAEKYEKEDDDVEVVVVEESSDESEQWDCETIVTTYSNLDNHPGRIDAPGASRKKKIAEAVSGALNSSNPVISLRGREKIPVDFLPRGKKSDAVKGNDGSKDVNGTKSEPVKRKQHGQESKEEKKERKAAVKEERREARRLKKEVKGLYRDEAHRAQRVAAIAGPSSIHLL